MIPQCVCVSVCVCVCVRERICRLLLLLAESRHPRKVLTDGQSSNQPMQATILTLTASYANRSSSFNQGVW